MGRPERAEGVFLFCPVCHKEVWVVDPAATGACTSGLHNTRTIRLQKGRSQPSNSQERAQAENQEEEWISGRSVAI